MVPRERRLPREAFHSHGSRTIKTPFFLLKTKDNEADVNRIGVVIGKSVDSRATRRNALERQIKTHLLRAPNLKKDFIFMAFPNITALDKDGLAKEVAKALEKAV